MKIILDCNYICYQSFYRFGEFKNGVIFGFLKKIMSLSERFESNQFLFCWDSRKSYRKLIYPEYKQNRRKNMKPDVKKALDLAYLQFDELRLKILPFMGFKNIFHQTGYEADDLVAWIVSRFPEHYIIITTDSDYYQLLQEDKYSSVKIYKDNTKVLLDVATFENATGIKAIEWAKVKAIAGCTSDNVKGSEGCGENKAILYLKNKLSNGVIKKRIEMNSEIIERNILLVGLPFAGIRRIKIDSIEENEKLYSVDFMEVFKSYGFPSLVREESFSKWKRYFGLLQGRG